MFANHVRYEELVTFYDVTRWGGNDPASFLNSKLNAAGVEVANDLRQRGIDLSRIYVPRMFDSLGSYAASSKTADYTSDELYALNEQRFVVDFRTDSVSASFALQGTNDGVTWMDVRDISGAPVVMQCVEKAIYSKVFSTVFLRYRYILTTADAVSYSPYLSDTAADPLVMHKAVMLLLAPYASSADTLVARLYQDASTAYYNGLEQLRINYSGSTDDAATVQDYKPQVYAWR